MDKLRQIPEPNKIPGKALCCSALTGFIPVQILNGSIFSEQALDQRLL